MRSSIIAATVLVVSVGLAQAGIRADLSGDAVVDFQTTMDMPFMAVGNAGNAPDTEVMNDGTTGYGAVEYVYSVGKFEVTAGQYTEFLNAVAATDAYGLYNTDMWWSGEGCKIDRGGSAGSYSYSVAADWADRPVNFVSWGDSARFANWLTNGMPTGAQDLTTTEDGSYFLDGAMSDAQIMAVTRKTVAQGARYVIPTEDEWYKAAYHKNDGITGNYFDYATSSDSLPSNDLIAPDPGNNATYRTSGLDFTVGDPYYRTEAGDHENSESPYGTFDMNGNIGEWNEAMALGGYRGMRGSTHYSLGYPMEAGYRSILVPTEENMGTGFRVAEVPEPVTVVVDIKPGSDPNSVNLKSMGHLPVVAYGTEGLDVTEIDLDTLLLNGVGPRLKPNGSWHVSFKDVDGDSFLDLVMHFETQALGIEPGMTELALTGALMDGTELQGADAIRIVPDFNGDLMVNATDLAIMKASFGQGGIGYADGNANCDALVNATDLAILKNNFGFMAPTGAPAGAVPEPVTMGMLALGGMVLLRRRKK